MFAYKWNGANAEQTSAALVSCDPLRNCAPVDNFWHAMRASVGRHGQNSTARTMCSEKCHNEFILSWSMFLIQAVASRCVAPLTSRYSLKLPLPFLDPLLVARGSQVIGGLELQPSAKKFKVTSLVVDPKKYYLGRWLARIARLGCKTLWTE